jgi:hypothetical protein
MTIHTRLEAIEAKQAAQDKRLDKLEGKNTSSGAAKTPAAKQDLVPGEEAAK